MGTQYSHIDRAERRRLQTMRDAKVPVVVIVADLGRHRSTSRREIRRNFYYDPFRDRWGQKYRGYSCPTADHDACKQRAAPARPPALGYGLARDHRLFHRWPRRSWSGFFRAAGRGAVSAPATLGAQAAQRPDPGGALNRQPAEVVARQSLGHWEGDLVIVARPFGKATLTSLRERHSRFHILLDVRAAPLLFPWPYPS